ncbi:alpha/beta hydrolase [Chlorogloeopsis sp. ULAP01]|nr:alpha/beta hydrolase [Chlorogloeopsis sp. ULAP01]
MSLGILSITLKPKPAFGAEQVYIIYGPLKLSLTVDSLRTFAETGKVDNELKFYARFAGDQAMARLRRMLQIRSELPVTTVSQLTYAPMSEDFLQRIGRYVQTESGINGFHAIRAAWILSASKSNSYTLIDVMRNYPARGIRIDVANIQKLQNVLLMLINYKNAAIGAIASQAKVETAAESKINFSLLPDPRKSGKFQVARRTLELQRSMPTLKGNRFTRKFKVNLYIPESSPQPAPVVVISHGMGSTPSGFAYLGEHLATHGFAVAIPEHIGSGKAIKEALFAGLINTNVYPTDFVERPKDIHQTLDELEWLSHSDPNLKGRLNLQNVGMIGHSFGGYTALAVAGARLNMRRVDHDCAVDRTRNNLSTYLQCLSQQLPAIDRRLGDPRIRAVISINPLTSIVFGPEGMSEIEIPTMLMSATNDILTAPVPEQIHPFLWLKTPEKYLALMVNAGHTAADQGDGSNPNLPQTSRDILFAGPNPNLTREYIQALSLAFMQIYIGNRLEYQRYLRASYVNSITQEPIQLQLVRSLTPTQLKQAYGNSPPLEFFPAPVEVFAPKK